MYKFFFLIPKQSILGFPMYHIHECCFGAGDCEGPVRPGPVLCVNVPPFFFFFFWFLWLVFYCIN